MSFIAVKTFSNYAEAHIVMGNLQEQNINCWLKDEYSVTIDPLLMNAVGGIKLMVATVQAGRAIELLTALNEQSKNLCVCPFCGSQNLQVITETTEAATWFEKFKAWFRQNYGRTLSQTYLCLNCGKTCEEPAATNSYIETKEA